jgi:hypothetical protein
MPKKAVSKEKSSGLYRRDARVEGAVESQSAMSYVYAVVVAFSINILRYWESSRESDRPSPDQISR